MNFIPAWMLYLGCVELVLMTRGKECLQAIRPSQLQRSGDSGPRVSQIIIAVLTLAYILPPTVRLHSQFCHILS